MRLFFVVSMVYLLASCVSGGDDAEKRVANFYRYYLPVFANSPGKIKPDPEKMHDYVSHETLIQLDVISHIYEQEIIDTDYYTYAQDYSVDWMWAKHKTLTVVNTLRFGLDAKTTEPIR